MAGESIAEATVTLRGDGAQLEGDVTKVVGNIGRAIAGLAVAKGAFDFVKEGVQRLGEMEVAAARTNAVIKSTGGVANVTAGSVKNFGDRIQDTIGVQADLVTSGQNVLLKYTAIRNEVGKGNDIFNQARDAMVDLSIATGKDMASSAAILGKALQDPEKGLTALKKAGVNLTEQQKTAIATFVETGDVLNAQKIILDAVNDTVGGSAKAFGETLPAKLAIAEQKFADMRAEVASAFLPAIEFGAQAVGFLSDKISELPGPLNAAVVGAVGLGAGLGAIAGPLNEVIDLGGSVANTYRSVDTSLRNAGFGGVATGLGFVALTAGVSGAVLGGLKLAGAFDDLFVSTDNLAVNSVPKLVKQFSEIKVKSDEVGTSLVSNNAKAGIVTLGIDKLGMSIEKGSVFYDRFRHAAEENVDVATRVAFHLADLGKVGEGTGISIDRLAAIIRKNAIATAENSGAVSTNTNDLIKWGVAIDAAKDPLGRAQEQLALVKDAMTNFTTSISLSLGPALSATNATEVYNDTLFKLKDALIQNGAGFDQNTQAGNSNHAMLTNLIGTAIEGAGKQIELAVATGRASDANNVASGTAQKLVNDMMATGAAAGLTSQDVIALAADILRIPPEAYTAITNSADPAAALVNYLIGQINAIPPSKNSDITVTTTYRTVYQTIGSAVSGAGAALGRWLDNMEHGGIVGAQRGLVTRGPAVRLIGEAGPEAVVPLGPTSTNKRDRDAIMKRAGLFQVQPMAHGGAPAASSSYAGWDTSRIEALLAQIIANQQQGPARRGPSRAIVGGRR